MMKINIVKIMEYIIFVSIISLALQQLKNKISSLFNLLINRVINILKKQSII